MMLTLIKNEIKKLLSRRKTLVMFIAFVLLVGLLGYSSYRNNEQNKKYSSPEFRVKNAEESIDNLKNIKEKISQDASNPSTPEDKKIQLNQQLEAINNDINNLEKEVSSLKVQNNNSTNWKDMLKSKIDDEEKKLASQGAQSNEYQNSKFDTDKGALEDQLKEDKYFYEKNVKPLDPFDLNAFTFIQELISTLGMIFLVIGVVVFSSDMVSGECTPATLKFLLIQPVSRAKVLFSKFVAVVCSTIILILSVELLSYLVMGLIFGFGSSNYPVRVGMRYEFDLTRVVNEGHPLKVIAGSSYIIPAWKFILEMLSMQALFIMTCAAFSFLLSTLFKSSMISMAVGIVSVVVLTILVEGFNKALGAAAPFLFVAYGSVDGVIRGNRLPFVFNNPNLTVGFCILVLVGWAAVSYLIAHVVFKKRDILI